MNKQARQTQILARIGENPAESILSTRDLAEEFGVSEITMRRDLQELAVAGLIQRRHGGVIKPHAAPATLRNVGIIVVSYRGKFSNPFFNELLEGADSELEKLGYRSAFVKTFVDMSTPAQVQELSRLYTVDGLLVMGGFDLAKYQLWKTFTPNIVTLPTTVSSELDVVVIDSHHGMRMMVKHLAQLGHTRIGFIMGHEHAGRVDNRLPGYLAGIAEQGFATDPTIVYEAVHSLERLPAKIGQSGAQKLMSVANPPHAIMCSSDLIALSAMQWLQSHGYRVPDDVAVTGFDNIIDTSIAYPPLTTIHVHKRLLGRLAAEQLHRRIEHPDDPPLRIVTPTSLVIRRSCGATGGDGA
ncbi:MAG: DeoR/GlpR family transcriptional regulator [Caldilineaceae bacterium]|nr:DeoR/GlpR family transcriptional regulator [Caldilineaceae bacterium]